MWDEDIKAVSKFIAKYIPDLESKPSIVERCFYTVSIQHFNTHNFFATIGVSISW